MKAYKYLMLHCTATQADKPCTPEMIRSWHQGPKDLPGGKVAYKGRVYSSRAELPKDRINGKFVMDLKGRGWKQVGYSALITFDRIIKLVDYDEDRWIESGEITNGAEGMNSSTRHIAYAGGVESDGKTPKDTRTDAQKFMMIEIVKIEIERNPTVLVCGHNQFANKACPSFDTEAWLRSEGIPEINIYKK